MNYLQFSEIIAWLYDNDAVFGVKRISVGDEDFYIDTEAGMNKLYRFYQSSK